mmetsp:Transcript_9987/g.21994  ORF Transcript_9987/g.21994 Transcript_9987/m.21994 type:complete len:270 (-) Transcript_9987:440-1249(-)
MALLHLRHFAVLPQVLLTVGHPQAAKLGLHVGLLRGARNKDRQLDRASKQPLQILPLVAQQRGDLTGHINRGHSQHVVLKGGPRRLGPVLVHCGHFVNSGRKIQRPLGRHHKSLLPRHLQRRHHPRRRHAVRKSELKPKGVQLQVVPRLWVQRSHHLPPHVKPPLCHGGVEQVEAGGVDEVLTQVQVAEPELPAVHGLVQVPCWGLIIPHDTRHHPGVHLPHSPAVRPVGRVDLSGSGPAHKQVQGGNHITSVGQLDPRVGLQVLRMPY